MQNTTSAEIAPVEACNTIKIIPAQKTPSEEATVGDDTRPTLLKVIGGTEYYYLLDEVGDGEV